jgi:MFS transporter, OFA family, oxalate/formate antiporter
MPIGVVQAGRFFNALLQFFPLKDGFDSTNRHDGDIFMKTIFDPDVPFRPKSFPFFYGWWILLASSVGIIASIPGQTMGFSVFTDILDRELDLSTSHISTAYLVGTVCSGLFLPYIGKLFDRFGARVLGTLVCAVMGLGLLYLSQVDRIALFAHRGMPFFSRSAIAFIAITVGFFWLRFTGQGALTMTSRAMLGKWFNHYRGISLSISGIVVGFSFSLAPRVLDLMIQSVGWRWTWAGIGIALMTIILLFVWLTYRDDPESCGLKMDGIENPKPPKHHNVDLIIHHNYTRSEALRTPSFWIFNLALGLQSFVITGYTFHVISIAENLGISRESILQAFVPSSVIGIAFSLIGGTISSRIRLKYVLFFLPLGGFVFAIGPAFHLQHTLLLIITGCGISSGLYGLMTGLVWPRFYGRKHLGAISGVNMATLVFASASSPLVFSLCKDLSGHYNIVFAGIVLATAICMIAALFADNPQRKYPEEKSV